MLKYAFLYKNPLFIAFDRYIIEARNKSYVRFDTT